MKVFLAISTAGSQTKVGCWDLEVNVMLIRLLSHLTPIFRLKLIFLTEYNMNNSRDVYFSVIHFQNSLSLFSSFYLKKHVLLDWQLRDLEEMHQYISWRRWKRKERKRRVSELFFWEFNLRSCCLTNWHLGSFCFHVHHRLPPSFLSSSPLLRENLGGEKVKERKKGKGRRVTLEIFITPKNCGSL